MLVGYTIKEQARQTLKNPLTAVEVGGANQGTIIKVKCYLVTMKCFVPFNEFYKDVFGEKNYPAKTCIAVAELHFGARLEIEIVEFRT